MFRHSISDMHDIVEGDIRFAHQFARQFSKTFPAERVIKSPETRTAGSEAHA
jgi:hypothetical protein